MERKKIKTFLLNEIEDAVIEQKKLELQKMISLVRKKFSLTEKELINFFKEEGYEEKEIRKKIFFLDRYLNSRKSDHFRKVAN